MTGGFGAVSANDEIASESAVYQLLKVVLMETDAKLRLAAKFGFGFRSLDEMTLFLTLLRDF